NADVPADLPDPYSPAFECVRRQPKPRVDAFIDSRARFLQDDILATAEHVQRADWRGEKGLAKQERARCLYCTCYIEGSGEMPAASNKWNNRVLLALDNDNIERVAIARSVCIRCAAVLFGKCRC